MRRGNFNPKRSRSNPSDDESLCSLSPWGPAFSTTASPEPIRVAAANVFDPNNNDNNDPVIAAIFDRNPNGNALPMFSPADSTVPVAFFDDSDNSVSTQPVAVSPSPPTAVVRANLPQPQRVLRARSESEYNGGTHSRFRYMPARRCVHNLDSDRWSLSSVDSENGAVANFRREELAVHPRRVPMPREVFEGTSDLILEIKQRRFDLRWKRLYDLLVQCCVAEKEAFDTTELRDRVLDSFYFYNNQRVGLTTRAWFAITSLRPPSFVSEVQTAIDEFNDLYSEEVPTNDRYFLRRREGDEDYEFDFNNEAPPHWEMPHRLGPQSAPAPFTPENNRPTRLRLSLLGLPPANVMREWLDKWYETYLKEKTNH